MYDLPVFYDYQNAAVTQNNPSTIHVSNTTLNRFFEKYLLQKVISVFEWELPDTWNRDYFLYTLYCRGTCAILNTDKFGVIPQQCSLRGHDIFYAPTHAVVTNPLLRGTAQLRIGTQCTLFKLQPDFGSIMDIVSYYANMLSLCAETAAVNTLNSKLAYIFATKNKAGAEAFKVMMDKISSGEPAVFIDKDLLTEDGRPAWDTLASNLSGNYIAG